MRNMTTRMLDALADRTSQRVYFVEVDHPAGYVRAWSGVGTLNWAGQQWLGVGLIGAITGLTAETALVIQEQALVLTGVPVSEQAELLRAGSVRGRKARVWLGVLTQDQQVVPDPILLTEFALDTQSCTAADDGSFTIKLEGTAGLFTLESPTPTAWTHEAQQVKFPGDDGFKFVSLMVDRDIAWTPT